MKTLVLFSIGAIAVLWAQCAFGAILWPATATDFILEHVYLLNSSPVTGWFQVPFPYNTNGSDISFTEPMPAGRKFYRLHKP